MLLDIKMVQQNQSEMVYFLFELTQCRLPGWEHHISSRDLCPPRAPTPTGSADWLILVNLLPNDQLNSCCWEAK
jgi:hypothetical protein